MTKVRHVRTRTMRNAARGEVWWPTVSALIQVTAGIQAMPACSLINGTKFDGAQQPTCTPLRSCHPEGCGHPAVRAPAPPRTPLPPPLHAGGVCLRLLPVAHCLAYCPMYCLHLAPIQCLLAHWHSPAAPPCHCLHCFPRPRCFGPLMRVAG